MKCSRCETDVLADATFCHHCGQPVSSVAAPQAVSTPLAPVAAAGSLAQSLAPQAARVDEAETLVWEGGCSGRAIFFTTVLVTIMLVAAAVAASEPAVSRVVPGLVALLWLVQLLRLLVRRWSVHYQLTTQRFTYERGLFRRVTNRMDVIEMDDIVFEQTFFERLLGIGTIQIASSDRTEPNVRLPGIGNVRRVSALFDNTRLALHRRRANYVESV